MVIEEPEDPLHFPVHPLALEATAGFATIGDFYRAIADKITELGERHLHRRSGAAGVGRALVRHKRVVSDQVSR